ncbi:MAG: DNA replication/repair protein RecF [Porphyromonadaceae bacterium]|nr:DNA replication/repair protein RecF [Porphyromonadaceae bacterium]
MILSRLSILNFKNIAQADLSFSPGLNCFLGNNGMGKTNLLEALYYLSFCKGFIPLPDSQNIRHGEEFFMLQGFYLCEDVTEEIYCGVKFRQKKVFKRNKKEYGRLADHIGLIPLVMISPADAGLIQGGSEERRRFLDMVISQFDKAYLDKLMRYNKALMQRNSLLKQGVVEPSAYEIWEEQMWLAAGDIYAARSRFLAEFIPVFQEFYTVISGGNEKVGLAYVSHVAQGDLRTLLAEVRQRDLLLGYTSRGVHKDELEMSLEGYQMKRIGSQGQNKTFLIALKLAQFDYLNRNGHTTPLLLLDDVFDKLDAQRMERIISLVSQERFGQIFVTDTNREYLDAIVRRTGGNYRLFQVENGCFTDL